MKHIPYSQRNYHNILYNAGVFPNDKSNIDRFCGEYAKSVEKADIIFAWGCIGEAGIIRKYAPKEIVLGNIATLDPLLSEVNWYCSLADKRILVIHPFADTILKQYERRELLFENGLLPTFRELHVLKAVQSNAGAHENLKNCTWFDVLDDMTKAIEQIPFDVALVGAGAYGMPLCAYCKSLGKQAVYMGGSLQLLFGIRGRRWDNRPHYAKWFNQYWVYPGEQETPKQKDAVEGGSYWR